MYIIKSPFVRSEAARSRVIVGRTQAAGPCNLTLNRLAILTLANIIWIVERY